ncbi:MAG: hypothetical protein K6F49_06555 [Saccharofermentans sp.]|nr:hypothetical protein [Saccharofermentans sp.]
MPHSGGGGSHGGGSHGGSHGGGRSGPRRSNHYFRGARRYRRHYYDGRPDTYFYSDGVPQKTSKAAIALVGVIGIFTTAMFCIPALGSKAHKLKEKYARPQTRIVDTIDIISNDDDLEDALEEYNDITGVCPVVQTIYIEDYQMNYDDLESYAYDTYLHMFSDEQHYLIVYAIPKDQRDAFADGSLSVPDYEWEIMIGDETDNLYSEGMFIHRVQNGLEEGKNPGVVIADVIRQLGEADKQKIARPALLNPSLIIPFLVVGVFFVFPIITMVRNIKKEKEFEYEEVPLEESDIASSAYTGNTYATTAPNVVSNVGGILVLVFMTPFVLIGIGILIGGIVTLSKGDTQTGAFLSLFGAIWLAMSLFMVINVITGIKKSKKSSDDLPQRPVAVPTSDDNYQSWQSHENCKADHEDDDNVRPGYE